MSESSIIMLQFVLPLVFIIFAMIVGSYLEKKHYVSIRAREKATLKTPVITLSKIALDKPIVKSYLVSGSVVVSVDYFKRILAALRNIFGGPIMTYESLVDRARREAILRMKAQCPAADIVINLKIETSSISKQTQNGQSSVGCVEVVAYGTAIQFEQQAA